MGDTDEGLSPEQRRYKETWEEQRGYWHPLFETLLHFDPEYVELYSNFSTHPKRVLGAKRKELIHMAIDAMATHMYDLGTEFHMEFAFDEGATVDEVVEVLELSATAVIESALVSGARLVGEELGGDEVLEPGTEGAELKSEVEATLGYWPEPWTDLYAMDPEHFQHFTELVLKSWRDGPLDPMDKELILIACAVTSTHLHSRTTRTHIRGARTRDATRAEIVAAIQTASCVGSHSIIPSIPIVEEVATERGLIESV